MAKRCSICSHPERKAIDKELVAGVPLRPIASRFSVSKSTLHRHKNDCLADAVAKAQAAAQASAVEIVRQHEASEVRHALDIVQQLKAINEASLTILRDAQESGDGLLALKAVDRLQRQIELQAKLIGELDERPQVNILFSPQWVEIRAVLMTALLPYPEARQTVSEKLLEVDSGRSD